MSTVAIPGDFVAEVKGRPQFASTAVRTELNDALGDWTRPLVTYLSGKPMPGEKPIVDWSSKQLYTASMLALFVGVSTTAAILMMAPPVVSAIAGFYGTCFTTGRLRSQQVYFGHYAAHKVFDRKNAWLNELVGDIATTLPFATNVDAYRNEHFDHHKREVFTRMSDEDAKFIFEAGFQPGMSAADLWMNLWRQTFSPAFHFKMLKSRCKSSFVTCSGRHRWMAVTWLAVLLGISAFLPVWVSIVSIWLPLIWGYQVAALLNVLTEHLWLAQPEGALDEKTYLACSHGRFCLEPPPAQSLPLGRRLVSWVGFAAKVALLHIPTRLAVMVADMPSHDAHHAVKYTRFDDKWTKSNFVRQASIDAGDPARLAERELWGLEAMLTHQFASLAGGHRT